MSTYVINHLIHFDSEAFVLYAATSPEETLRIGAIASRCLTQLLQANGQIVSKRDLMSGAWGAFGLEVTDNSLAQVIRQLRVALEKLQPNHELILTIPRIGYKINEQVELLSAPAPATLPRAVDMAQPVAAEPPVGPEPRPGRAWASQIALGLAAIACWAALFQLPGLLRPASVPVQPFVEYRVEKIAGVTVHLEDMPASTLKPDNQSLVAQARQLGEALGLDPLNLHLYRLASSYRSLNLLCEGALQAPINQCLGLQPND